MQTTPYGSVGWVIIKSGALPAIHALDPHPYQFLTLEVSLEAVFLSLFILMSPNGAGRHANTRRQLDLQINLLAEQESTKLLQMLQSICAHHKLAKAADPEIKAGFAEEE